MLAVMRPNGTPQQLEKRRRLAIQLLKSGKTPATVARAVSASRSSVQRWQAIYQRDNAKGLNRKPIPGRPPRLTAKQKTRLERRLLKGAVSAGYATDLWTLDRISQLIEKHFGVHYHPGHVWRILQDMGWSSQKPERRPIQRDEVAIRHWRRYCWPRIKKG
ncbi:MAG: IS630 family transposase [Anaerolineales bacterium]